MCAIAQTSTQCQVSLAHSDFKVRMHEYRVIDSTTDKKRCVLKCHTGRYHVARMLNFMPPAETSLRGHKPHLGFDILLCAASGAVFRVIFESINGDGAAGGD
jgi:hypothetical protein